MTTVALAVVFFVVAFFVGLRSTFRLWARYRRVISELRYRERLILQAFVAVSAVTTIAAGYFGALTARRLIGFPPIEGTSIVSTIVAAAVLFIPLYLERIVDRVAVDRRP